MSPRRPRVCAEPGCATLTATTYCATHTRLEAPRPSSTARGYDRYWRRLSAIILRRRPKCECADPECGMCAGDGTCPRRTTEVDHITPVRYFADRRAADHASNLRALCHECHSSKTARLDRSR